MTVTELKDFLEVSGIPDALYNFEANGKEDDGRVSMMQFGKRWRVYLKENGIKRIDEFFESEEEACDFFYKQLID
ncbi:MAG: hypothetical protein IJ608_08345 [Lachnospiraceae bacterium]|nr:hypothetical protein [Lachnospiraceae bacterium]